MKPASIQLDPAEAAALYVAGALTPAETTAFESRLDAQDPAFVAALREVHAVQAAMLNAIDPIPVAPAIRAKVLAYSEHAAEDHAYIQRDQAARWQSLPVPGISFRVLFVDRERNLQTIVFKVAPDTILPTHEHAEAEDCYIVEGELETLGTTLRAGDYFRIPPNTTHASSRTRTGCTLLINSALDEDLAAAWN